MTGWRGAVPRSPWSGPSMTPQGLPQAIDADRRSIVWTDREPTRAEQRMMGLPLGPRPTATRWPPDRFTLLLP
jgi:hypothetical protein